MSAADCLNSIRNRDWEQLDSGTLRVAMIGLGWWTHEQAIPAVNDSKFCETTIVDMQALEAIYEAA